MGLRFPQQVTRIDTLTRQAIDEETEARILAFATRRIDSLDAVLLSHYHGGLLTSTLVKKIRELCQRSGVLISADVQGKFGAFGGLDVIKCNADDAQRYLNRELTSDDDFSRAALELASALGIKQAAIITRGSRGATVACDGAIRHCPAPSVSDVFDTVGAGDTAIATTTLALASGLSAADAVTLANYASGIVVRHLGNYAPTPEELIRSMRAAL
jgi:D-beta-D-heptose 7-phosphate kinase/D-beta-D-heptose 1-phosphate adenosyltransferase